MGRKARQSVALAERRARVGDMYLQNWTQTAIAERLGIAQSTVCADLKAIQQSWRESAIRDFDQARVVELQKLNRIEREASAGWQRSQKPAKAAQISGQGTSERSVEFIHNQVGDPRFLDQIQKCFADRQVLLQLDISAPVPPDQPQQYLSLEERRARLLTIIETIRQRQAAAADRPAAGVGESSSDCTDCPSTVLESGPEFNPPRWGMSPCARRTGHGQR
jgi:hypothetical protein